MSERPRYVTIDGFDYYVMPLPPQDTDDMSGDYHRESQQFRLNTRASENYQRRALMHELFHALWDHAGLSDDPTLAETKEQRANLEEKIVEALSGRLLPVLRDNKPMIEWLIAR